MASKTFSGQLDQAMNEAAAEGNKILFIPQQTVGEVLPGAASELVVESDGTYSIKLAYNTYSIYHYSDVTKRKTLLATDIVVSTDTAVTTIPDLLGSVVPVTEDSVLTIQGYLDEANEAKTDAETAQAATEALFDDFDSSVADSMALVHTDTPSLSIPFNESGRLDYGVGTEYVSGLPVYGVDFTRSTSCYYINKSGLVDFADVDEIAIGSDGAYLHNAFDCLNYYTNDITQAGNPNSATITTDGTESPFAYTDEDASLVTFSSSGDNRLVYSMQSYTGTISIVAIVKPVDSDEVRLRATSSTGAVNVNIDKDGSYYAVTGASYILDASAKEFNNGWYEFRVELASETYSNAYLYPVAVNSGSAYVAHFGVLTGYTKGLLMVNDTGASTSVTATTCTVPVDGNLPATGKPFTFIVRASGLNADNESGLPLFSLTNMYLRKQPSSLVYGDRLAFYMDDDVGGTNRYIATATDFDIDQEMIVVCTYNGSDSKSLYVNGDLVGTQPVDGTVEIVADESLIIGTSNSQIKNFTVLPYAASADEVKSWGAPK